MPRGDPTRATARFTRPDGAMVEQQYDPRPDGSFGPLVELLEAYLPDDVELTALPPEAPE